MTNIKKLLNGIDYTLLNNETDIEYQGIEYDSRKVCENSIYIALKGTTLDGHDYIQNAIELGAKCILVSQKVKILNSNITYILVENLRDKLGIIGSNFYDWPQKKLKIIGVTGTNGKTTITYILEKIMKNSIKIGTIEYKIGDEIVEALNTTPESLDIVKMCKKGIDKNLEYLIMEVSSHALLMGRVEMLDFDVAIFSNLTSDHMDYHKTIYNYFLAKRKLFTKLKNSNNGVYNIEDMYGNKLYQEFNGISYGEKIGDMKGKILNIKNSKQEIEISYNNNKYKLKTGLLGRFNLMNIQGAIGGAIKLGIKMESIIERLNGLNGVPGRFETVNADQDFMVIVDFAHTEDALKNILQALNDIKKNKIITVFGCGGDRDVSKRSKMATVAEFLSDFVVLTSDNPRTENPQSILDGVEKGFKERKNYISVINREEAIKTAIIMAKKDDIVLIAGKGHEKYQIIGKTKIHFDDVKMAEKYIRTSL